MSNQLNYYDYTNYYGLRMFAIAAVDAMPRNYSSIIFTGTYEECMLRLDPPGLEGSVEDLKNKLLSENKDRIFRVWKMIYK